MNIRAIQAKSILTPQTRGFLAAGPQPYTHTLSWAIGCGLGMLYCGAFCYAQYLPNWLYARRHDEAWGKAVIVKENAPALLDAKLSKTRNRPSMRIFMSPVTDPYQPLERKLRLTRRCLDVFQRYGDLDLLLIQTRAPAVQDDLHRIADIPYAWLSVTLETDRHDLPYGPSESHVRRRLDVLRAAVKRGINTQIAVAPCLPYSPDFAEALLDTGAHRIVIDSFAMGDGKRGARTANSPFAQEADYDWRGDSIPTRLYQQLKAHHPSVSWSAEGFAGVPGRFSSQPSPDFPEK